MSHNKPFDADQLALETAQAIGRIDPGKLPGGETQAIAQAQCLILDAMQAAIEKSTKNTSTSNSVKSLEHIQKAMECAYNSAIPVCCQRGSVNGCCGESEPSWPEWAESVITTLDPVKKELTEFLRQVDQRKIDSVNKT